MLTVNDLHAHYGKSHVLNGVRYQLKPGEIGTILGRNGSGRSTLCKAIIGLLPPTSGSVALGGRELAGRAPHEVARAGIGYVPEEREIFLNLSVDENMTIGRKKGIPGAPTWTPEELYDLFPRLRERRRVKAGSLSGGEQQMLTMFRTLLGNPLMILIDEPTEGLAPKIVGVVRDTVLEMKRRGIGVLLLEQKLSLALQIADHVAVMGHGEIVFEGSVEEFRANHEVRTRWLEVS
ncbi:ABC transporter ATP-binding protein [Alcanivorax sp. N3-2A]|nr:ABC transporter ATP-binding protein [Alcanivorax sp. N3-2A]|tara:strand:+ start:23179 stop:23883 length:705 start_codon:yes stop_codon:yes gene_type:complete